MVSMDFWIALLGFGSLFIGYVIGRWEMQDQQTRTYRHGYNIGKKVGEINGRASE